MRDPDEDTTTCRECGAVEQIGEAWERLLSKARESLLPRSRATRVAEILAGAQINGSDCPEVDAAGAAGAPGEEGRGSSLQGWGY